MLRLSLAQIRYGQRRDSGPRPAGSQLTCCEMDEYVPAGTSADFWDGERI